MTYKILGTCKQCNRDLWVDDRDDLPDGDRTNIESIDLKICQSCHLDNLDKPPRKLRPQNSERGQGVLEFALIAALAVLVIWALVIVFMPAYALAMQAVTELTTVIH